MPPLAFVQDQFQRTEVATVGVGDSPAGDDTVRLAALDSALVSLACLEEGFRHTSLLPGGLTNTNVHVVTPSRDVVVRVSTKDSDLLAIDRAAEHANSLAAAMSGAAPSVVEYAPDQHLLVIEYVEGRTLTDEDLADADMLKRVAAAVRVLHRGPRFVNDFDMFEVQRRYLDTAVQHGFRLPGRYLDFMPKVSRIHAALSSYAMDTVPCNNDLLAANFIDDGERIWIIDYEYSGNNDPCFELGNIWSEASLPNGHLDVLVSAYFGDHRPDLTARARLLGLMSKYGWTLWASIQDATSQLDFDFWEWGMQKYDRAVAEFDGPDFEQLLEVTAQTDGGHACPTQAV